MPLFYSVAALFAFLFATWFIGLAIFEKDKEKEFKLAVKGLLFLILAEQLRGRL